MRLSALLVVLLVGCASQSPDEGGTTSEEITVNASNAFCPAGSSFDAQYKMCVTATEAIGPFPSGMVAACRAAGGGEPCKEDRWEVAFARSIRGRGTCGAGSKWDTSLGVCVESDDAYGPFTKTLVARCKQFGGGPACETMRWHKSFIVPEGPRAGFSAALTRSPHGLHNPLPGGSMCGYAADTGLDICSKFAPVYAVAAGTLDYSEPGHTSWNGPRDTANSVRLKLDVPFVVKGRRITHVYYTHLSGLRYRVPESGPHRHVAAGEQLGVSGTANDVPHLHLGFIVNGRVAQDTDDDILKEWDVRLALGSYAPGEDLPAR